jgi:hypothetical protein
MASRHEVEPAVVEALGLVTQLVNQAVIGRAGSLIESNSAQLDMTQTALHRIVEHLHSPEFSHMLLNELMHGQLTLEPPAVSQNFIEEMDGTELSIQVCLYGHHLQIALPESSISASQVMEYQLNLETNHLGILRLFILRNTERVTSHQIIQHGLAGKQNGVTQMIHTINAELYCKGAGYIYIDTVAPGQYQLQATHLSPLINEFFRRIGFKGSFGRYYLTLDGIFYKKGWQASVEEDSIVLKINGSKAQVLSILILNADRKALTLQEITEIMHVHKVTASSALGALVRQFNNQHAISNWQIRVGNNGRTKTYQLVNFNK